MKPEFVLSTECLHVEETYSLLCHELLHFSLTMLKMPIYDYYVLDAYYLLTSMIYFYFQLSKSFN